MVDKMPEWMKSLEEEDLNLIFQLLQASGSLKEVAKYYQVSYLTIRLRLNRIQEKIEIGQSKLDSPYVKMIKNLVIDNKISYEAGKALITACRKEETK